MSVKEMLREIEAEVEMTRREIGRDKLDPRVMHAMAAVARHEFVPEEARRLAYYNGPLQIGYGQTISQPYIVALMTDLLEPQPDDVILEIGTGSGYQAAVLAHVVKQIYSVEIVQPLADEAQRRLQHMGYVNVEVRAGDGYHGWPEHAPYDGIIVTAAAPHVPQPLLDQLKPGGNLVIPIGEPHRFQELFVVRKELDGSTRTRHILGVAFVPLTGTLGKNEATP